MSIAYKRILSLVRSHYPSQYMADIGSKDKHSDTKHLIWTMTC